MRSVQEAGDPAPVDLVKEGLLRKFSEQKREIRSLRRELRVYHQLDNDLQDQVILPPDHPYGYLIAFCAFASQFIVLGSLNTYSVFNRSMAADNRWGHPGFTKVALVNAVANFLSTIVGAIAGHTSDVYGLRPLFKT